MPFTRPTLQELIARNDAELAGRLTAGELAYSDRKVLARMLAGAAHGLYGNLDWLGRQILPDPAQPDAIDPEWLDRWVRLFGLTRNKAAQASGPITCSGGDGVVIPAGTVLTRKDGAEFTTDADGTVAGGTATVAVTASLGGAAGNTDQDEVLSLVNPVVGLDTEAVVAAGGLTGGLDEEAAADLLVRLLLRMRLGVPNGKAGDHEFWARAVNFVTRAWQYDNWLGLGTVGVTFVIDNDAMDATIIPNGGQVATVQASIDAKRPRPGPVTVFAPTAVALNFTIGVTPNTAAVKAAVTAELKDLLRRDSIPAGTIYLTHINEAISLAEGETDHVLTIPAGNIVRGAGEIAVMGVLTWA